jgi:hypothetical protein
VLIGGMGLGAEVGYWYLTERKLQHAADVSAFGAAVRLSKGDETGILDEIALNIAQQSGFDGTRGKIEVHHPPVSGPECGRSRHGRGGADGGYRPGVFRVLREPATCWSRPAVARITSTPNPACLIALAPSGAQSLSVTGNGSLNPEQLRRGGETQQIRRHLS